MSWLFNFWKIKNIDPELNKEKKTSSRSQRKFQYGWLKFSFGKDSFQNVNRVYSIGWVQASLVDHFVNLLENELYEDLGRAFEDYQDELNASVHNKPSMFIIDSQEFLVFVMQDDSVYLKIINGVFTQRKIYLEKKLSNIQLQRLSKRKLIYPV